MSTARDFLPLLSKKAALPCERGIGIALANKTRRNKRPQANMQRASRKQNRGK